MTLKQFIEATICYPEDSELCLMYNGGDTCGLDFMETDHTDDRIRGKVIGLEPDRNSSIANP